jgi:hypothetical protein
MNTSINQRRSVRSYVGKGIQPIAMAYKRAKRLASRQLSVSREYPWVKYLVK